MSITLYFADANATTITQADKLYSVAGSPTTTNHTTAIGTATGWGEIFSGGTGAAWAAAGSAPAPSKHGFLWDVNTLDNQTMLAGVYSATVRLQTAGTGAGTVTADIHCRAYKYSSGVFTAIADMVATAQSITTTNTNFTVSLSTSGSTPFATNDRIYFDILLHVTANTGASTQTIRLSGLSTDTATLTGSNTGQVVVPGTTAIGAPSTNSYGSGLDSGGTPNKAGSLYSTSNTRLAINDSGAKRVRWQIEWYSIERAVQTTSSDTIAAGTRTINLAVMDANYNVGNSVLVDVSGTTQETVTVTARTGTNGSAGTISAVFAKAHDGSTTPFPVAAIPGLGTNARPGTDAAVAAYDWSVFDDFVNQCNSDGTFVHFVLQNAPVWHATTLTIDGNKNVPIATDAATFATAVMQRAYTTLGVPIGAFEVANEGFNSGNLTSSNVASFFNQMYTYVSAVRTSVKAISTTTLIGAPAELNNNIANVNVYTPGFFTAYSNPAISTLVDYANFHFYPSGAPDAPASGKEGFTAWLTAWKSAMTTAGISMPVYVTEWGWTFNTIGDTNYTAYLSTIINDSLASGIVQAVLIYNLDQIVPAKHFNDTSTTTTYKTWKNFIATQPQFISVTALTAYLASAASTTIVRASELYTQVGSPSFTNATSALGKGTGYGEVTSQGTSAAWANAASLPFATGFGFFLDSTLLENQQILSGIFTATLTLKTAGAGATSITADVHCRLYNFNQPANTYTQVAHMIASGQTITTTASQFTLSGTTQKPRTFTVGSRLYADVWLKVTSNVGATTQTISLEHLSTDTLTFTGSVTSQIVTPGYNVAPTTGGGGGGGGGSTATTQPYAVTINGSPVTVLASTLNVQDTIGKRGTASFTVLTDNQTYFQQYQQVAIYDQNNVLTFSGYITKADAHKPGFQPFLLHNITCTDQHWLADKRIIAAVYTGKPQSYIVQDMVNKILSAEGVTIGQIYDGPFPNTNLFPGSTLLPDGSDSIPSSVTFAYATVAQALDELAKRTTTAGIPYYWSIDQNAQLWFVPYTAIANSTEIDGTQLEQLSSPPVVTRGNALYRNTQYIVGGVAKTVQQSEPRTGDGTTRSWTMGYAMGETPQITVNNFSYSIATKGAGSAAFYYAIGDPVITQDNSQPVLTSSDTLVISYRGQYPSVFQDSNVAQITYQAGIDNSTGIVEDATSNNTITNASDGLSEASSLLKTYAAQGLILTANTLQTGFSSGQIVSVNLPDYGINNAQMLMESVVASDASDGYNIWYTLTLLQGPYDVTWVDFFSKLVQPTVNVDNITVGATSSVTSLSLFTASVTPSATYTATVHGCPVPGTSQFPSTSLFPC